MVTPTKQCTLGLVVGKHHQSNYWTTMMLSLIMWCRDEGLIVVDDKWLVMSVNVIDDKGLMWWQG